MRQFLVIQKKNLPTKLPISNTLLILLALDHWNMHWFWWIAGCSWILLNVVLSLFRIYHQKPFNMFPGTLQEEEDLQNDDSWRKMFEEMVREG